MVFRPSLVSSADSGFTLSTGLETTSISADSSIRIPMLYPLLTFRMTMSSPLNS